MRVPALSGLGLAGAIAFVLSACGSSGSHFTTYGLIAPVTECMVDPHSVGEAEKIDDIDEGNGCQVRNAWRVQSIAGVTPDPVLPAVREWCINTAAVDPATMSILANSEDGTLYRWDMVSNSFTQAMDLTQPTSEAYTPTVIGVDGTVYAINNSTLFAVG